MIEQLNDEEAARERHRQRIEQMRKSKQKQLLFRSYFRKFAPLAAGGIAVCLLLLAGSRLMHKPSGNMQENTGTTAAKGADDHTDDTANDITNVNIDDSIKDNNIKDNRDGSGGDVPKAEPEEGTETPEKQKAAREQKTVRQGKKPAVKKK